MVTLSQMLNGGNRLRVKNPVSWENGLSHYVDSFKHADISSLGTGQRELSIVRKLFEIAENHDGYF